MRRFLFCLVIVPIAIVCSVSGQKQTEKALADCICAIDIAAVGDSTMRYSGERISSDMQDKTVSWADFFDTATVKNLNMIKCEKVRSSEACTVDSFHLFASSQGVYIEYGSSATLYTLTGNFPVSRRGIGPNMSQAQIVAILGKPIVERENQFQYLTDDEYPNNVILFFRNDSLRTIIYTDRWGDCME